MDKKLKDWGAKVLHARVQQLADKEKIPTKLSGNLAKHHELTNGISIVAAGEDKLNNRAQTGHQLYQQKLRIPDWDLVKKKQVEMRK